MLQMRESSAHVCPCTGLKQVQLSKNSPHLVSRTLRWVPSICVLQHMFASCTCRLSGAALTAAVLLSAPPGGVGLVINTASHCCTLPKLHQVHSHS